MDIFRDLSLVALLFIIELNCPFACPMTAELGLKLGRSGEGSPQVRGFSPRVRQPKFLASRTRQLIRYG